MKNNEYTIVNGRAIVYGDEGVKPPIDYTDKTHEILVGENVVETMENKLDSVVDTQKQLTETRKAEKKANRVPLAVALWIMGLVLGTFLSSDKIWNTALGTMTISQYTKITIVPAFSVLSAIYIIFSYLFYRKNRNIDKSFESAVDVIEKEIEDEKEKVEKLELAKKKVSVPDTINPIKVDHIAELESFRNKLFLLSKMQNIFSKLVRLYNAGKLRDELSKTYDEDDIEFIESTIANYQLKKTRVKNQY